MRSVNPSRSSCVVSIMQCATAPGKAGLTVDEHESGGFHAWNNWRNYLNLFAPLLFKENATH